MVKKHKSGALKRKLKRASDVISTISEINNVNIANLKNENYPTDIAHYPENLTMDMKKFIINYGACIFGKLLFNH